MRLESGQYYGNIEKSVNINGLILTQSCFQAAKPLPLHYHKNPYFCYVTKGNYIEKSSHAKLLCTTGDVIFHPANTEHQNSFMDNITTCFNLELEEGWINRMAEKSLYGNTITKAKDQHLQTFFLKINYELCNYDHLSSLMIEG